MIKSDRSKRRKKQEELRRIHNIYFNNDINETNLIENNENNIVSSNESPPRSPQMPSYSIENKSPLELPSSKQNLNFIQPLIQPINCTSQNQIGNNITITSKTVESLVSFKEGLSIWAVQCNVPHATIDKLLKLMKKYTNINTENIPFDSRTLLNTPSSVRANIRSVNPGKYSHFGLKTGILRHASYNLSEIKVVIGIDGLPLAKSSNSQLWPILAYIVGMPKTVFPVGIYHGNSKPNCSDDFLTDFISEAKEISANGIVLNNILKKVSINIFICDAPAKAFVMKIKGHSGFSSCTRCVIEGEYYLNRVCFPYSEIKSIQRTHYDYINKKYEEYHVGPNISRLVEVPGMNMVHSFPLDYMHLVCLGVVRKLILLWLYKGPLTTRLPSRSVNKLSASLLAIKSFIPSDFVRKTREIQEVNRWKATELRLFLLYIGPVVLKNIVTKDIYTNFMALHVSMVILLSPNLQNCVNYAKDLLDYFVKTFQFIYGREHVSHNIHGLLHLSDDYTHYGPLDNCSAYPFENFMKELKSKIRKHEKPIEQLINRYREINNQNQFNSFSNLPQLILSIQHHDGPLIENIKGLQYKKIILNNIKLNVKFYNESFILTKTGDVVKVLNIIQCQNNKVMLIGKQFEKKTPFYEKPINSKILDIYTVDNLIEELKYWNDFEVKKKMMVIEHDNSCIAMPIMHTEI